MSGPPTIAIVGGGASGTLAAIHLLHQPTTVRIVVAEEQFPLGRGLAYRTLRDAHILNVPAGRMSAYPDDPDHFLGWAAARQPGVTAASFLPRHLYGEYLEWCLEQETTGARQRSVLTTIRDRVRSVTPCTDHWSGALVHLARGATVQANHVVLAVGNSVRPEPTGDPIRDPWSPDALESLSARRPVVLLGTGLTAVDMVLTLEQRGFGGTVYAVSRRGLLPQPHRLAGTPPAAPPRTETVPDKDWTARSLVAAIRAEAKLAQALGGDWRTVVDGLRPHTADLWAALPEAERARLARHALRYWDVHRHRMAPEIAARITALQQRGRLVIAAGKVTAIDPRPHGGANVTIRPRIPASAPPVLIHASAVIGCTGPNTRLADDPLFAGLFQQRAARPGPIGLGVDADGDGRLIDTDGHPSPVLWALGPLRRGGLLETTAIPEIRGQAAALAKALTAGAASERCGSGMGLGVPAPVNSSL